MQVKNSGLHPSAEQCAQSMDMTALGRFIVLRSVAFCKDFTCVFIIFPVVFVSVYRCPRQACQCGFCLSFETFLLQLPAFHSILHVTPTVYFVGELDCLAHSAYFF